MIDGGGINLISYLNVQWENAQVSKVDHTQYGIPPVLI